MKFRPQVDEALFVIFGVSKISSSTLAWTCLFEEKSLSTRRNFIVNKFHFSINIIILFRPSDQSYWLDLSQCLKFELFCCCHNCHISKLLVHTAPARDVHSQATTHVSREGMYNPSFLHQCPDPCWQQPRTCSNPKTRESDAGQGVEASRL